MRVPLSSYISVLHALLTLHPLKRVTALRRCSVLVTSRDSLLTARERIACAVMYCSQLHNDTIPNEESFSLTVHQSVVQVQADASGCDILARSGHGVESPGKFHRRCPCMFKASRQPLHKRFMHYSQFIFLDIVRVEAYGRLPVIICVLYYSVPYCTVLYCTIYFFGCSQGGGLRASACDHKCTILYFLQYCILYCTVQVCRQGNTNSKCGQLVTP